MTTSKTFYVQRSGSSVGLRSHGGGLQAGSKQRSQKQRQDNGWTALARWLLAILVALGLSVQVEAREAREAGKVHAVKSDTVVAGRIVGVSDGDTVTLLTDDLLQQRVRLRGIDAPEKAQAFGNRSKQALFSISANIGPSLACFSELSVNGCASFSTHRSLAAWANQMPRTSVSNWGRISAIAEFSRPLDQSEHGRCVLK